MTWVILAPPCMGAHDGIRKVGLQVFRIARAWERYAGLVASLTISTEALLERIGHELEAQVHGMVATMMADFRVEIPEFDTPRHPELWSALRASCYGNLRIMLAGLASDRRPPDVLPPEAIAEAQATARAGVPLLALLRTYPAGQAIVYDAFLERCAARKLDEATRSTLLGIGSRYLFAYMDAVTSQVVDEYARERERLLRGTLQRRVQRVRDVLRGLRVDESALGYNLQGSHVALVAAGAEAEETLRAAADAFDGARLVLPIAGDATWAWLACDHVGGAWREALEAAVARLGTVVGIGEPARQLEGFRDTHRQAQAAHRVAGLLGSGATRYDDVALEAMALADEQAARAFMQHELGALAGSDARTTGLRETLHVYLASSMNASVAAARLGIADRTVAYRVRRAEELLDRHITHRGAELACALRLHALLRRDAGEGASPPSSSLSVDIVARDPELDGTLGEERKADHEHPEFP